MSDEYGELVEYSTGLAPEVLEERRKQIGSSDVGAIVGLNPWAGPRAVYDSKVGLAEDKPQTDRMLLGTLQEPATIAAYAALHHRRIWQPGVKRLEGSDVCVTRVDALSGPVDADKPDTCVEAKNVHFAMASQWGPDHTNQIPLYYVPQVLWHCGIWGMASCDVVAMIGGELHVYHVMHNALVFGQLVEAAERFWRDHVVAGVRPGPDGTKSCTETLQRIPWRDDAVLAATPETEQVIADLMDVRKTIKAAKVREDYLRNVLREQIGTNSGIKSNKGSVSWRVTKARPRVDWQAMAESMNPTPEQLEQFTIIPDDYRRLSVRSK